jgi:hypothetical protein
MSAVSRVKICGLSYSFYDRDGSLGSANLSVHSGATIDCSSGANARGASLRNKRRPDALFFLRVGCTRQPEDDQLL